MNSIALILFLGLISSGEMLAQGHKKMDGQINFGTTLTVPYKKTISVWSELENHPETNFRLIGDAFYNNSALIDISRSILIGRFFAKAFWHSCLQDFLQYWPIPQYCYTYISQVRNNRR